MDVSAVNVRESRGGYDLELGIENHVRKLANSVQLSLENLGESALHDDGHSDHLRRANEIGTWHMQKEREDDSDCYADYDCNTDDVCWDGVDDVGQAYFLAQLVWQLLLEG
jgi:hypothetical protein